MDLFKYTVWRNVVLYSSIYLYIHVTGRFLWETDSDSEVFMQQVYWKVLRGSTMREKGVGLSWEEADLQCSHNKGLSKPCGKFWIRDGLRDSFCFKTGELSFIHLHRAVIRSIHWRRSLHLGKASSQLRTIPGERLSLELSAISSPDIWSSWGP